MIEPRELPPRKHTPQPVLVMIEVQDGYENTCEECDNPFPSKREDAWFCTPVCGERFRNRIRPRAR